MSHILGIYIVFLAAWLLLMGGIGFMIPSGAGIGIKRMEEFGIPRT
jgi:hypothetical protein